jgi:hypothetical protein
MDGRIMREKRQNKPEPTGLIVRDYNGTGRWSRESIVQRYKEYASRDGVKLSLDLKPQEQTSGTTHWVYPVMFEVIKAIEAGDPAAIQIGIEFIEEDLTFTFGKILKSRTARALRRASLSSEQAERVRKRVIQMLLAGHVPHEYQDYAKLLRKVGVGEWWSGVGEQIDRSNPYVMRFYRYFTQFVVEGPAPSNLSQ